MKQIRSSNHAAVRYCERVKPTLLFHHAEAELRRLIEMAPPPTLERPRCVDGNEDADAWLELAPGIICPLKDGGDTYHVLSVLTTSGYGEETRKARNDRKRRERAAKRARRAQLNAPDRREASPLRKEAA